MEVPMTGKMSGDRMSRWVSELSGRPAFLWALALALLLGAVSASAQSRNTLNFDDDDEIVIRGEVDKPEAFYILAPSNLSYQTIEPETSFLDELYETTEDATF
jgi:hypothetical protein